MQEATHETFKLLRHEKEQILFISEAKVEQVDHFFTVRTVMVWDLTFQKAYCFRGNFE